LRDEWVKTSPILKQNGTHRPRKTKQLSNCPHQSTSFLLGKINSGTIELIRSNRGGDGTKIINLVKSIQQAAEKESGDPFLIALSERAKAVQESFEDRRVETADAQAPISKF